MPPEVEEVVETGSTITKETTWVETI